MAERSKQLLEEIHEAWENEKEMYAMYLRKSRADLELEAIGEEETLSRHKAILLKLADRHDVSASQIDIYHEIVSGESIDSRPQMQRLLEAVYERKYKAVLCVQVERLARGNTRDQGEVAEAFQYSHTTIITPSKTYDPDNEFDQQYFEFGLFMSRREYKTIRRRLINGKRQAVQEGNFIPSHAPYGYKAERISKKERILVEDPDQSKYLHMIFDWYTEEGKTTSWIANTLTDMGVKKSIGYDWGKSTILGILRNETYIGKIVWGSKKVIKEKDPITGKTKNRIISTGDKHLYQGKHKPLISVEQFEKARSIYGSHTPVKHGCKLANPLSGLLFCSSCGKAINFDGMNDPAKARYRHAANTRCKLHSIQSHIVINAITQALQRTIADYQIILQHKTEDDPAARHKAMLSDLHSQLLDLQRRKRNLMDDWDSQSSVYTRDEFIERKQMYNDKINAIETRITEENKNEPVQIDYEERISSLHAVISSLSDPSIQAQDKNAFLKSIIAKITMSVYNNGHYGGNIPTLDITLR